MFFIRSLSVCSSPFAFFFHQIFHAFILFDQLFIWKSLSWWSVKNEFIHGYSSLGQIWFSFFSYSLLDKRTNEKKNSKIGQFSLIHSFLRMIWLSHTFPLHSRQSRFYENNPEKNMMMTSYMDKCHWSTYDHMIKLKKKKLNFLDDSSSSLLICWKFSNSFVCMQNIIIHSF